MLRFLGVTVALDTDYLKHGREDICCYVLLIFILLSLCVCVFCVYFKLLMCWYHLC